MCPGRPQATVLVCCTLNIQHQCAAAALLCRTRRALLRAPRCWRRLWRRLMRRTPSSSWSQVSGCLVMVCFLLGACCVVRSLAVARLRRQALDLSISCPVVVCDCQSAEKEKDAALNAILDRVVGLGWEKGWTPKLSSRWAAAAVPPLPRCCCCSGTMPAGWMHTPAAGSQPDCPYSSACAGCKSWRPATAWMSPTCRTMRTSRWRPLQPAQVRQGAGD